MEQEITRLREALELLVAVLDLHQAFYSECEYGTEMPQMVSVPMKKFERAREALNQS